MVTRMPETDEFIEQLMKELDRYSVGGVKLSEVFEPLVEACRKVAKNKQEEKMCIMETISVLKQTLKRM